MILDEAWIFGLPLVRRLHDGDCHVCLPLSIQECVLDIGNFRVHAFQLSQQLFSHDGIRIAQRFRVQNTAHLPAIFKQGECFEQVVISIRKRRIHHDQIIAFVGLVGEKIIVHNTEPFVLQNCAEVGVDFHTVNVRQLPHSPAMRVVCSAQQLREVSFSGGRFQRGTNFAPADAFQQFGGQCGRRRIKSSLVR